MKKFLCMFFLLSWCIPVSSQAEDILNTNESFTLAKTLRAGGRGGSENEIRNRLNKVSTKQREAMKSMTISKDCDARCQSCNRQTGVCSKCLTGNYLSGNKCISCPSNAKCEDGKKFVCKSGYYKKTTSSCGSCANDVAVANGKCKVCSDSKTCTSWSCNSGATYTGSTPACKLCSDISVANGSCTGCNSTKSGSEYTPYCTAMKCSAGYSYREARSGVWTAGCYPEGTCPSDRPDLQGATCMHVGNNDWECKTDSVYTSTSCSPCSAGYYPKNAGACVTCAGNVSVANAESCLACTTKGVCTKARCKSGYYNNGGSCEKCSKISVANGQCTGCSNDGKCTSMSCNSGYAPRLERMEDGKVIWKAGCYLKGNCPSVRSDLSGATCMNVGNDTWQCKTDSVFTSTECKPCGSNKAYRSERKEGEKVIWKAGCYPKGNCPSVRPSLTNATCMDVGDNTWQCKTDSVYTSATCTPCQSGYAYRTKRDGVWSAGCYPKGNCPTVRSDLEDATCMNVGNGNYECKTDTYYSGTACKP